MKNTQFTFEYGAEPIKDKESLKHLDSNDPTGIYYKYYQDFVSSINNLLKLNAILKNPLNIIDITNAIQDVFSNSPVSFTLRRSLIMHMIDQWNASSEFKISADPTYEFNGMPMDGEVSLKFNY